jgi:acyl carrier protein
LLQLACLLQDVGAVRRHGTNGGDRTLFVSASPEGDSVEPIIDEVRQVIAKELKIPLERLTPDTALRDLGAESLDFIEIIFALEEKFNISIPYNANEAGTAGNGESTSGGLGQLETIDQISAAVKELVDAKTSA